jgi:hypothetical protein
VQANQFGIDEFVRWAAISGTASISVGNLDTAEAAQPLAYRDPLRRAFSSNT